MFRNRMIYLALLIFTGTFASFFGGNITHLLFYAALSLPLFSFFYTSYVNARFKIHQTIPKARFIKKENVPYYFILANEDFFTFTSIEVSFFDETSHVTLENETKIFSLGPTSSKKVTGSVYGDYRGTYEIGASSVRITDFLNLFQVTYAVKSPLRLIISPRILNLEHLNLTTFIKDSNITKNSITPANELIDTELRKYVKGDNRKLIHWKASAKKQELLTKKTTDLEEFETLLFLDLEKASTDEDINFIAEDKIIELALAIANHFLLDQIPLRILYQTMISKEFFLQKKDDLDDFYEECVSLKFTSKNSIESILKTYYTKHIANDYYIIISPKMNAPLFKELYSIQKSGKQISYFYIRTKTTDDDEHLLQALRDSGVIIYDIWMDEDLLKTFVSN